MFCSKKTSVTATIIVDKNKTELLLLRQQFGFNINYQSGLMLSSAFCYRTGAAITLAVRRVSLALKRLRVQSQLLYFFLDSLRL